MSRNDMKAGRRPAVRNRNPGAGAGRNGGGDAGDYGKRHAVLSQVNPLLAAAPEYVRIPAL